MTFSTRPPDPSYRPCSQQQFTDPLLEPQKLSGSFIKYSREAMLDKNFQPITNSALERIRGDKVTFDNNRPQVIIEQNVLDLQYDLLCALDDTVNSDYLWGFPPRCVKLSDISWERKFYGLCTVYFTRRLTFDIDTESFDRTVFDEGTKVLHGHWESGTDNWVIDNIGGAAPNPKNPKHFDRAKDRNGTPIPIMLNGKGEPAGTKVLKQFYIGQKTSSADLSDETMWYPINGNSSTVITITPPGVGTVFKKGDIISTNKDPDQPYICYVVKKNMTTDVATIINPANAIEIGPTAHPYPVDAVPPTWIPDTTYNLGQIVRATTDVPIGQIMIEYYQEGDFTQLGIPLTFTDFSSYYG